MANTGTDLWGWSCGDSADFIQPQVQFYLNFNDLCMIQVRIKLYVDYYALTLETRLAPGSSLSSRLSRTSSSSLPILLSDGA